MFGALILGYSLWVALMGAKWAWAAASALALIMVVFSFLMVAGVSFGSATSDAYFAVITFIRCLEVPPESLCSPHETTCAPQPQPPSPPPSGR